MPPFIHTLDVRYADTDAQGHVFFANAYTYMDEGLTWLMEHIGLPYGQLEADHGVICVFAASGCRHRSRILFGSPVEIVVRVQRLGNTSFTTAYTLQQPGEGGPTICAQGELTSVCLDADSRQPVRVPDALRAALRPHQTAG